MSRRTRRRDNRRTEALRAQHARLAAEVRRLEEDAAAMRTANAEARRMLDAFIHIGWRFDGITIDRVIWRANVAAAQGLPAARQFAVDVRQLQAAWFAATASVGPLPGAGEDIATPWVDGWPSVLSLAEPLTRFLQFAAETFPQATGRSTATHLQREVGELLEAIDSGDEAAVRGEVPDVVVLALQAGMRLLGPDLARALEDKLAVNRGRTWGEPDADGVVEHTAVGVAL